MVIDRLGTDGAGLVSFENKIIVVAGCLPGERVKVDWQGGKEPARLLERLTESSERVTPICRHYVHCGGCSQQHFSAESRASMQSNRILNALARVGLGKVEILPVMTSPEFSRRRASFEAVKRRGSILLGFHEAGSHQITAIEECPVLRPEITIFLPRLRALLLDLLLGGEQSTIVVSITDTGLDVGLSLSRVPDLATLELLGQFADQEDLARLWWRHPNGPAMPLSARRKPLVHFGDASVELPPLGFQQATSEGEQALISDVLEGIGDAKRVADLFAGIGTFSLPLGKNHTVHAVEENPSALQALDTAARAAKFHQFTTERRDLYARPLLPSELNRFDAVIFDPPRAGAREQVVQLAQSTVPVILGISCDPATFARDAAILVSGGYRLEQVRPVDQFRWSSHLELVARFRRH